MNRVWYVARALFLGLAATQCLATLHVYLSNRVLFETVRTIKEAGYLAVPNPLVAPTLKAFGPAFFGGVFFTLSLGAGLSVFALVAAWIWVRILARNRTWLGPIVFLWLAFVAAMNGQGFSAMVSAYFLIVPFVVFTAAVKWMPPDDVNKKWFNRIVPFAPIALLTLIWTAQADRFLFLDIRDFLLLSNPVGQKVDDFYYRYTLYPAQVFKTLQQKTLKTCHVTAATSRAEGRRVRSTLIDNGYLPVGEGGPVDVKVVVSEKGVALENRGAMVIQTTLEKFLAHPAKVLQDFSARLDRHGPFRQATIICLVLGFPVLLYVAVFAAVHFLAGGLVSPTRSFLVAALLCFVIGLALLAPLVLGRTRAVRADQVSEALNALAWRQRVSGLRTVVDEKLEIGLFPAYRQMVTSPHLPERYWVAKALGASRHPETFQALTVLLDDPHPNVVSMAFDALGRRGNRQVVGAILKRMETSDHWYNQWYAYRALQALGWRQDHRPRK
jgi:hypothetical protein